MIPFMKSARLLYTGFVFLLAVLLVQNTETAAQNATFVTPYAPEQFPCGAITVCSEMQQPGKGRSGPYTKNLWGEAFNDIESATHKSGKS
ncbi:hypothetical protein [Taibaiella chishuiensis]|nr:hypothetical protein [Taibaiella chishuiensis]